LLSDLLGFGRRRASIGDIVWRVGWDKESRAMAWVGQGFGERMTQLSEIYNQRILELSANIPRAERLADADATATAHSKLCGSTVTVDLKLAGDRVAAYGQTVKACLLGQAAASVMGHNILGSSADELREVGAAMRKMLKANGPPPTGRWADLTVLEPVKDYKARHASTLLVFDAVESALAVAEAKQTEAAAGTGVPESSRAAARA
jgi:NifU-like protein involved in Fe-S cluster formation